MEAIAVQKYVRSTPKKMRIAVAMINGLSPAEAVEMLPYSGKRASEPLSKVIKSAMANAKQKGLVEENLRFKEIQINEGPMLKRGKPVSKGRWHPILKRWSHVRIVLTDDPKSEIRNPKRSKSSRSAVETSTNDQKSKNKTKKGGKK